MRVLHIGLCSVWGGIESFALNYFRELRQEDIIFDFADIYGQGIAGTEEITALGGKVISLPNYKKHPIQVKRELIRLLQEEQYDSVHIHMQTAANILPALAAAEAEICPILHGHTAAAEGTVRAILHRLFLPRLRKLPAIRLACGKKAGEFLWGNLPFTVLPNAVRPSCYAFSAEKREQFRKGLGIEDGIKVLGFVGRLEAVKNPMFVLDLAEETRKAELPCLFLLVGEGSLFSVLEQEIQNRHLEDRVRLLGYRKDVADLLSAFDVYLMPSLHEAFSLSAVEAQMNGLPCLLSDSIPRETDITGLVRFVPLGDLSSWVTAMRENPDAADVREDLSGLQNSPYNIAVSGKQLRNIYEQSQI